VKRQVENALVVTAKEFGKMGQEEQEQVLLRGSHVGIAGIDSANRQLYQQIPAIMEIVKYALS